MSPGPGDARERRVVLNVDDNEPARYAKGRVLTEGGYSVIEASSGPQALELAVKHTPDVILLDVGLPGLDGIEVCRRLKSGERTAAIPVVQVSASFVQESDRIRALEGGADTYLTEPIEPRVLLATVGAMLRMRSAEAALRHSEMRFRRMADAAPVLMWRADQEQSCTWFNQRWYEFTGGDEASERGSGWSSRVHPADLEALLAARAEAYAQRRQFRVEFRLRRCDGEYRWLLDHGVPLLEDETFVGFLGSSIDITERKTSEEERATLLQLERAAREESERVNRVKDEFLATLSHELRTPLSAILGWAHVLRSHAGNEHVLDAVSRIERNARAQARIIEDLLDMSRIISGKIELSVENIDLDGVVLAAIEAVTPAATSNGVAIRLERETTEHVVAGDADRLQQVVVNLLTNAVKFSSPGGVVDVRVRDCDGFVECEVEDHGRGIAPEFLPHVFERFRQADASTSRSQTGLGLGLAIVKNLIELHGGAVEAHSDGWGRGAQFRVRVPRATSERTVLITPLRTATAEAAPGERAHGKALEGLRVLIVDDDADARDLLERVLHEHGAQLAIASSAARGLDEFRKSRPDVIVSDIGMPGFDGYAFIRQVRELEGRSDVLVPAVALTAFARREDRQQVLNAGYQDYVAKPFQPDALVRSLAGLARRAR